MSILEEMLQFEQELATDLEPSVDESGLDYKSLMRKLEANFILKKAKMYEILDKLKDHLEAHSKKETSYKKEIEFLKGTVEQLN